MIHKESFKAYKLDLPPLEHSVKRKMKMWANLWALDKPLTFEEHTQADKCIADSLGAEPKTQQEHNKSVGDVGRKMEQAYRKTDYINNFNNGLVNCVAHNFDPYDEITPELNVYSEIFGEPIVPIIGVMRNPTDKLASFPPHYDKVKAASINIILELGGSNVETIFYEDVRTKDFEDPFIKKVSDCTPIAKYKFEKEQWHLFNTQRLHSVENIETRRVTVSLMPESAPTIEEFLNKYNYLVKEAL